MIRILPETRHLHRVKTPACADQIFGADLSNSTAYFSTSLFANLRIATVFDRNAFIQKSRLFLSQKLGSKHDVFTLASFVF